MSIIYPGIGRRSLRAALRVTVFVDNGLDQDVTVQVKGNRVESTEKAVDVGSSFTVSAGGSGARTLTPDSSGYLPYIYVELSCSTAPSSGSVSAYLIYGIGSEVKLVDSLEIRDTSKHDPSTDPDKIFIRGW